jgi:hypothetical protein
VGLPVRQRRVLDGIESKLRTSDPRLAVMFAIFSRLTRDEEMPRIEELRRRAAVRLARVQFLLAGVSRRVGGRIGRRYRMAVVFPAALVVMTLTIVLVARFGSTTRCVPVTTVAAAKPHPRGKLIPKAARRCRPTALPAIPIGR